MASPGIFALHHSVLNQFLFADIGRKVKWGR
jgi:hypothetical protein